MIGQDNHAVQFVSAQHLSWPDRWRGLPGFRYRAYGVPANSPGFCSPNVEVALLGPRAMSAPLPLLGNKRTSQVYEYAP